MLYGGAPLVVDGDLSIAAAGPFEAEGHGFTWAVEIQGLCHHPADSFDEFVMGQLGVHCGEVFGEDLLMGQGALVGLDFLGDLVNTGDYPTSFDTLGPELLDVFVDELCHTEAEDGTKGRGCRSDGGGCNVYFPRATLVYELPSATGNPSHAGWVLVHLGGTIEVGVGLHWDATQLCS